MHPGDHLELTPHPLIIARSSLTLSHHAGLSKKELQGRSVGKIHVFSRRNTEGNLVIGIKTQGATNPVIITPGGGREFLFYVDSVPVPIGAREFQPLVGIPPGVHFTNRSA